MKELSRYLALASAALQQRLAYRNAFLLSIVSNLLVFSSLVYVWQAVYAGKSSLQGFTWPELQTYLLLTFFTNVVIGWHSEMAIVARVLDGSVATDLLRPFDFQLARMVETLGVALFEAAVMLPVLLAVALALGDIRAPADTTTFLLALGSFVLGAVIKFAILYITCILAFWTQNGWGIVNARMAIARLFSGALVPLPFMPDGLRAIAEVLPFQATVYLPSMIYLGRAGDHVFRELAAQALWAVALLGIGRLSFGFAMKKVTIHGG